MSVLDLSKFKKAETAARHLAKWCRKKAVALGYPETEVVLREPGKDSRAWRVAWESGPSEWVYNLTGGNSYMATEFLDYTSPPEVVGFDGAGWESCPYTSFELGFFGMVKA